MKIKWGDLLHRGRALYLAYDQGLEHGPETDFNDKNVDPRYILDIARKGRYQGIVFHKGIVEKYQPEIKKSGVSLIYKLNGKTKLKNGEPISAVISTVKEARKVGAKAVGFTIYIGSKHESEMIEQFEKIQVEAHKYGLPTIVWIYPRGGKVKNDTSRENMAYAARVALEIGADMVKLKYNGKTPDLKWAVKSAGRCKLVVAGGSKKSDTEFLKDVKKITEAGATGLAVGRNIWKSQDPIKLTAKVKTVLWSH